MMDPVALEPILRHPKAVHVSRVRSLVDAGRAMRYWCKVMKDDEYSRLVQHLAVDTAGTCYQSISATLGLVRWHGCSSWSRHVWKRDGVFLYVSHAACTVTDIGGG